VGPNVTEANAALATEHVRSAEAGGEWSWYPKTGVGGAAAARPGLRLGVVAFWNDFRDAVGNVTIARGPGTFPVVGFVAAGGVGRQRLNLERIRVRGLELSALWRAAETVEVRGEWLFNEAEVQQASRSPGLVGRRVAQVPRESATLAATWRAPWQVRVNPRLRWIGRQFEDDENQLVLGKVAVADVNLSRPLSSRLEIFVAVENLGDARVETGRTADGVVNVGQPRLAMLGVRGSW
jgi:outer membrane receptor protein involved in Fe transport